MLRFARLHPPLFRLTRASHIGAAPIPIPPELTLSLNDGPVLTIVGPRGSTEVSLPSFVSPSLAPYVQGSSEPYSTSNSGLAKPNPAPKTIPTHALELAISEPNNKVQKAEWGLTRALIANAVTGIARGYTVELNLVGVGYRAVMEDNRIGLKIGFAHFVYVDVPEGVTAQVPLPTRIILSGNDKHQLGQLAANIRAYRKPEPYKGKGIFVGGETIKLKDVKKK